MSLKRGVVDNTTLGKSILVNSSNLSRYPACQVLPLNILLTSTIGFISNAAYSLFVKFKPNSSIASYLLSIASIPWPIPLDKFKRSPMWRVVFAKLAAFKNCSSIEISTATSIFETSPPSLLVCISWIVALESNNSFAIAFDKSSWLTTTLMSCSASSKNVFWRSVILFCTTFTALTGASSGALASWK